jgi:diguanylate cyclase (GGDEF)-like protein
LNGKRLRVLLAEGETGWMAASLRQLYPDEQGNLELTVVSGLASLMATLGRVKPELLLLDLAVAHPDPLDAVRLVHRAAPDVPLIVLGEEANQEQARQSINRGAQDFLLKGPLEAGRFERMVRAALQHNTLGGLANLLRDAVTGLYTREGFLTLGSRAMENAKRRDSTLVLLCMRIENLPEIRGEFGTRAAENCARKIGALLSGSFRQTDIIARLGETQFAALAIDAVEPSGPVLRQRLERRIAALNREIGPWGPLEMPMNVRFWSAREEDSFAEWLDSVEAGLRTRRAADESQPAVGETVPKE